MARGPQGRAKAYVSPQEARYIELTLQSTSPVLKKQTLQRLCNLSRRGFRFRSPMVVKGLVIQSLLDSDPKVKRWAFNALTQLGAPADVPMMMPALDQCRTDTEIFEAGLTALARILPKEEVKAVLSKWGVAMNAETVLALAQLSYDYESELVHGHKHRIHSRP